MGGAGVVAGGQGESLVGGVEAVGSAEVEGDGVVVEEEADESGVAGEALAVVGGVVVAGVGGDGSGCGGVADGVAEGGFEGRA